MAVFEPQILEQLNMGRILNAGKLECFEFSLQRLQKLFPEGRKKHLQQNPEDFQSK